MAVVKLLPGGLSGGCAPPPTDAPRSKRGKIRAWSAGAARRNLQFLWSIDTRELHGQGYAVTLTLGDTPDTADLWQSMRDAWLKRLRRLGMHRYHWVTEWTARGRPHLHAAIYTTDPKAVSNLLLAWLDIADANGFPVATNGQHIVPITGVEGWLQYVSKHASRGVTHYQHLGAPEGWESTGKLWGKGGDWPEEDIQELEMSTAQFVHFRNSVWAWMLSDMERRGVDPEFVERTRQRWDNPEHGNHHGISGWIPAQIAYDLYVETISAISPEFAWEK